MRTQGKVWGKTAVLFAQNNVEVHRIEILPGGYSSKHKHEHKHNLFCIESGRLLVTAWQPSGTVDVTEVGPGQTCAVPPGVFHSFESPVATSAIEIYWVEIGEDIVREGVGGRA